MPTPTIYLDWNATTPPHPEVLDEMRRTLAHSWANPASVHAPGRRARAHLDDAREAVAHLTGLHARDVVLTSGGTEANNLALFHAFTDGSPASLIASRLEHPSVTRAAEELARRGTWVEWVDVSSAGLVTPEALERALDQASRRAPVRLVCIQAVNHETGTIHPLGALLPMVHARGALLHVDAVQAVGRLPLADWSGGDLVALAAHKIRGPKGIGALVTRPGLRLSPLLHGGSQERGIRPGTQDASLAAGFAVAAHRARSTSDTYAALGVLRDRLEGALISRGALRNGSGPRAPHVSNLSFPGWKGDELAAAMDLEGVAVSSGSACSAGTSEPSPVITAVAGDERARSALRISLGEETSDGDVAEAIRRFQRVLGRGPAVSTG